MIKWMSKFLEILMLPKKMEEVCYPEFLNTVEKWNECVRNITSVGQFEEIFYKIMDDPSVSTLDVLRIMRKLENDIFLVHGNKEIYCVMDIVDSIIRYMITATKECEKEKADSGQQKEEEEVNSKQQKEETVDSKQKKEEQVNIEENEVEEKSENEAEIDY